MTTARPSAMRVPSPNAPVAERPAPIEVQTAPNNLPAVADPKRNGAAPMVASAPMQGAKSYPPSIARSIIAVKREVGAIEKAALHKQQNYMYQAWEDILNAVSPLVTEHGLIIIQSEVGRSISDAGDLVMINYEFTITHETGDVWPDRPVRSALSMLRAKSGFVNEKAIAWCDANAEKTFYKQFFNIRTKDVEEVAAPTKPPVPSPSGKVAPHAISTKDEKVQTWAPKFMAHVMKAESEAELTEWETVNAEALDLVYNKAPLLYDTILKAFDTRRGELGAKPAEKPAGGPPVAPSPDKGAPAASAQARPAASSGIPSAKDSPDEFLKWADAQLGKVVDPHSLEVMFNDHVEPQSQGLLPPDREELLGLWRKHENRLAE